MNQEYIVILQSIWMNSQGSGISYDWNGERFATREGAIEHGWEIRDSDDFNIGVVEGDRLVGFYWMDEPMNDDEAMTQIAEANDLEFKATGEYP